MRLFLIRFIRQSFTKGAGVKHTHPLLFQILTGVCLLMSLPLNAQVEPSLSNDSPSTLTLRKAIALAQSNDEWLLKSKLLGSRLERLGEGASALPDPTISVGLLNLPTDGFAFGQEPMTQLKVGASQMFPRGDSLALATKRYQLAAQEQPYLREDRRQKIALHATQLWLMAYEGAASYHLVNDARPLFDKLGEIVSASYASSVGSASQQDIIRAELELVRLKDRLIALDTQKQVALSKLSQYLTILNGDSMPVKLNAPFHLPNALPSITEEDSTHLKLIGETPVQRLYSLVTMHPLVRATEQRVRALAVDIEIAEQVYKPQYGVNASYALRDDTWEGQSRADFFSIGVSISIPLFSNARQDANVAGASLMTEAVRTEKLLIMRELMAGLNSAHEDYRGLTQRIAVYEQQILPRMTQQADAALNAYTNDTGDFAEVVRAKIAELDAQITLLSISIRQRMALANIRYFLSGLANTKEFNYE